MLRHAGILARSLLQARGFSLAFLVTLSVALGGSTVVFGVVRTLLFRPLPYSDVERLVVATPTVTWGMYTAMRDSLSILEKNAAYIEQAANVSIGPHIERAMVAHVTSGFFEVTGVRPSLGRLWDERESGGGSHPVVLISHDFKRRHFGSEGDAIGKTLVMDGEPRTVIGVLPVGFGTLAALEAGRGVSFDTKTALLVPLPGDRQRPFNEGTDHGTISRSPENVAITRSPATSMDWGKALVSSSRSTRMT